jgi:transposase
LTLEEENIELKAANALLSQRVSQLDEKLTILLDQMLKSGIIKDSHNSSKPPSSDFSIKNKSLRPASNLKSGGQPGHEGNTLEMKAIPDKIIELKSDFCSNCGHSLKDFSFVLKAKRQVVEIPPILPIFEEYQQFSCTCQKCNHAQIKDFPLGVNAPIQYGSSVEANVVYNSVFQNIPFARLQKMFFHQYSLPISQGTIGNILERVAGKCTGIYQKIKAGILESSVAGSDETGAVVNGKKWWIWVWQTLKLTYIQASESRGFKAIMAEFEGGFPKTVLVSDRWAAQLKAIAKNHQLCLAHLQRDLIYLEETEKHPFASQFKSLISDIFKMRKEKRVCREGSQEANLFETRLKDLIIMPICNKKDKKTATFQKSILKYCNYILPCIYNLEIPPDNNGSERAIRTIKVKQKVSGQFKTGQHAFCVIRSVIDTIIKQKLEVFPTLQEIIRLQPV